MITTPDPASSGSGSPSPWQLDRALDRRPGTAELAELLGVETTTVRTRLFRARKALAKVLEDTGLREDDKVEAAVTELGRVL